MTVTLEFPVNVLVPMDASVAPAYDTRPGQQATNGMRRSVGLTGAQWKMKFDVAVYDEQTVRAARALFFNLEGDSQLIRIKVPDRYGIDGPFAYATQTSRDAYPKGIPFATDAMFSTGIGHAIPTLETTFAKAASLNDREIYVAADPELPAGCAISIDEFCYGIAGSWAEDDGSNRLKISPPLRKAAAAGDAISLAPLFVGYCITEVPGYETLRVGKFGTHTLEFVEDLTRLVESAS